ncbi:MAG: hypothetical protein ABR936_13350 [Bacteroidota bacterium]|jgi:hypothetical protein
MDKTLKRASKKIEHDDFVKLMKLTLKQSWLEEESEALIELWNLCKFTSEQELVFNLLLRFKYLNSSEIKKHGIEIADHIMNVWNLPSKGTRIVAVSDNRDADGSQMLIQSLKNKFVTNNWKENNFINNIGDGVKLARKNYNIILLDDFIGTGNTIERRVKWTQNKIAEKKKKNITIRVVCLAALEIAKSKLDTLGIEYYSPIWLRRGISDHFVDQELTKAVEDMKRLESELAPKYNGQNIPSFGYKKSESLFVIEAFNVPNNVFPIFWWPVLSNYKRRNTLLKRLR